MFRVSAAAARASRGAARALSTAAPASSALPAPTTLRVVEHGRGVVEVALHRPGQLNAMNKAMWEEIGSTFAALGELGSVRAIVLTGGEAKGFTSGLDLSDHADLLAATTPSASHADDTARRALQLRRHIAAYQRSMSALAEARQPVIAAVHGACLGGGVDLIAAADIRLASACAFISVMEAEIGLCADVGTLQRLPKLVSSDSWAREVCLTARRVPAAEAHAQGLFSGLFVDAAALRAGALAMAHRIAALSPVAVQGTKANLNWSRDRTVADGLAFQAAWSAAALQTQDIPAAVSAAMAARQRAKGGEAGAGAAQPQFPDA